MQIDAGVHSVRDRLIESWNDTQQWFTQNKVKRVYYMSLEFLMGRSLANSLFNLDLTDEYKQALADFGRSLEEIYEEVLIHRLSLSFPPPPPHTHSHQGIVIIHW